MPTIAKRPPPTSNLRPRLLALSDKRCDLLKRDLKEARAQCHRWHAKRIWEALDREDRETVRRRVAAEAPHLNEKDDALLLEARCVRVIEEELKKAGRKKR